MENFLPFFEKNLSGIGAFLLLMFTTLIAVNYGMWLFGIGRYRGIRSTPRSGFAYIFAELMVKIITDFRHFLALILVLIFAGALIYACQISNGKVEELSKALQAVVSTLGGLIGSIVGYYFGESAAKSKEVKNSEIEVNNVPVQTETDNALTVVELPDDVNEGN